MFRERGETKIPLTHLMKIARLHSVRDTMCITKTKLCDTPCIVEGQYPWNIEITKEYCLCGLETPQTSFKNSKTSFFPTILADFDAKIALLALASYIQSLTSCLVLS